MEVGVRVVVEDLRTRARVQATRAYLTFVAVDEAGHPRPVPPLALETDEDRRRFEAASRRREARLAERRTSSSAMAEPQAPAPSRRSDFPDAAAWCRWAPGSWPTPPATTASLSCIDW